MRTARTDVRLILLIAAAMAFATPAAAVIPEVVPPAGYTFKPAAPCLEDPERAAKPVRPGQAAYQVCEDQMALFAKGLAHARASGKLLLVTFGATWCPWCSALQRQLPTAELLGHQSETLDFGRTFHHIEIGVSTLHKGQKADIPSGEAVLAWVLAHAPGIKVRSIPFVAVIDPRSFTYVYARNIDDAAQKSKVEFNPAELRLILAEAQGFVRDGTAPAGEPNWLVRKLRRWWNG